MNGQNQLPMRWEKMKWLSQAIAAFLYAFRPKRFGGLLNTLRILAAHRILPEELKRTVPEGSVALTSPEGLAGICPDLDLDTLMRGYRRGLFQMSHAGAFKWWAPKDRMVLFMDKLRLEKNLKRKLRQGRYSITIDKAFAQVVAHCAGHRDYRNIQLTWILPEVAEAFQELHEAGHAHSVEVWSEDGELVGGLFGVSYGYVFATESQFSHGRDASKIAFAVLNRHLQKWGYVANDVRRWTSHLEKFGCAEIPRELFSLICSKFGKGDNWNTEWDVETDLCSGDWEPASETGWTEDAVIKALIPNQDESLEGPEINAFESEAAPVEAIEMRDAG